MHPLLSKETQTSENWLSIRTSYPHTESEWVFLSRKGDPPSRQQFYHTISTSGGDAGLSLEIRPHMLRHLYGFALANMGIDTQLIQDYLGHRSIRHTVWYTASNAGRLRNNTAWSYNSSGSSSGSKNKWRHVNTWLERDIIPLRSRLTLGDGHTQGDVFDGINFHDAQLVPDDNMLPDSQGGFASVTHGIARDTAQVTIEQNEYDIYNSAVPPGPFTINDIYAVGNSDDLQVTIKKVDGSTQVLAVPYSSIPLLRCEGHTRYSIAAGEYRSGNARQEKPRFF